MGTVWRVEDLKQNRNVAAKIMRQSHSTSLLRFVREQSLRIHHPHVLVPLGWAGEDDRVLFTIPIVALMLGVNFLEALAIEGGLLVFFLVFTVIYTWIFDRAFGLPASAK